MITRADVQNVAEFVRAAQKRAREIKEEGRLKAGDYRECILTPAIDHAVKSIDETLVQAATLGKLTASGMIEQAYSLLLFKDFNKFYPCYSINDVLTWCNEIHDSYVHSVREIYSARGYELNLNLLLRSGASRFSREDLISVEFARTTYVFSIDPEEPQWKPGVTNCTVHGTPDSGCPCREWDTP